MAKQTNTPKDWRILAERDMAVADHLAATMSPAPTEIIAFHCQQTAEKYLKGVLEVFDIEPPYTHDLDILCSLAQKHRPSFASITPPCTMRLLQNFSFVRAAAEKCMFRSPQGEKLHSLLQN